MLGEQRVEPLDPELLAAAPRLDDAVCVHDDDRTRREGRGNRLVHLWDIDPERKPVRGDALDGAIRKNEPRLGVPAAGKATSPFTASITSSTMVMKRPEAISEETTSFAAARNSPGTTCSRASDRKTYFAIAMSAVASTPWPVRPEHDREPPVAEREVVVDVAADLEARRGS